MGLFGPKKLTCFYCNSQSNQTYTPGLRQWTCPSCSADNFLDSNGEITETPAAIASGTQPNRFVQARQTSITYPDDAVLPSNGTDDLFCPTCQKNQHLYTQSLAAFYPSAARDASSEAEYERAEKLYRKGLEERFPLICETCEPRVQERLRKVNYEARADHMGRIMNTLRGGGRRREASGWKGWALWLAGVCWTVSWLCQIIWSAAGVLRTADAGLVYSDSTTACLRFTITTYEVLPACFDRVQSDLAYYGLLLGLSSIWWHPQRIEKLGKRYGRFDGESQYYKLQIVALAARSSAWYYLTRGPELSTDSERAIHLFLLLFSPLIALLSYRTVTIDYTPPVSFKTPPEPLIKRDATSKATSNPVTRSQTNRSTRSQPFPIASLSTQASTSENIPRPPTPPQEADFNDPNSMEWTPTRPSLQPRNPAPANPPLSGPSPFHGRLPTDIVSPAHRLRKPPNKPSFQAASTQKKASLFSSTISSRHQPHNHAQTRRRTTGHPLDLNSLSTALSPSPSSTLATDDHEDAYNDDDLFTNNNNHSINDPDTLSPRKYAFQDPRFFPPHSNGAGRDDTGLEGIMERSFRLDETPLEVREGRDVALARAVQRKGGGGKKGRVGGVNGAGGSARSNSIITIALVILIAVVAVGVGFRISSTSTSTSTSSSSTGGGGEGIKPLFEKWWEWGREVGLQSMVVSRGRDDGMDGDSVVVDT